MPRTILVVPTGHGVGLTTVCLSLVRACERQATRVEFVKPIAQPSAHGSDYHNDPSIALMTLTTGLTPPNRLRLRVPRLC